MKDPTAIAYARALAVWAQWLSHWRLTREPRHLRTALACRQVAAEKLAAWHAELRLSRSALLAARVTRTARAVDRTLRAIRHDQQVLFATQSASEEATPEDQPDERLVADAAVKLLGNSQPLSRATPLITSPMRGDGGD